ncbi:hypothetical protein, partial [Candidatus Ichthyocystis sparus]|uniref:hypothetical protein n=1 Tax=Candidatus Ichthyocystis sparus TaxID=1561004 RepID=UPI001F5EDB9B
YAEVFKSLNKLMNRNIVEMQEDDEPSRPVAGPRSPVAGRRQHAAAPEAAAQAPSATRGRLMDEMRGKLAERAGNANRKPDMSPKPQRLRRR